MEADIHNLVIEKSPLHIHMIPVVHDQIIENQKLLIVTYSLFMLYYHGSNSPHQEELCVAILEAYVRYLIIEKQTPLIATYVATLPQESQVEWYASFLESEYSGDGVH